MCLFRTFVTAILANLRARLCSKGKDDCGVLSEALLRTQGIAPVLFSVGLSMLADPA
jgi:hypothetical protein